MDEQNTIILFEDSPVRRLWHQGEWWYSIIDAISILSESSQPSRYWTQLRDKIEAESGDIQLFANIEKLKMPSRDGRMRGTEATNRQGILRLIQSIPSPKAEPFKQWLAQTGDERMQEEEDPNLILERLKQKYRDQGYDDVWIDRRIMSRVIRGELTDEWKERGIISHREYAILTAEISKGTFGILPSEHKKYKDLKRENLRDHMTNEELIFMMLGEEATKKEAIRNDHKGFNENKIAAMRGGEVAGKARETYEEQTGEKVVSSKNFKAQIKEAKKQKRLEAKKKKEDKKKD